jgi:hypothetical protein
LVTFDKTSSKIAVNWYALPCTVLVIMAILISGLDIMRTNYIVLGELPSGGTWSKISSVTNYLVVASIMSTYLNSSQRGNTTMNIPSNDTILNSNITDESTSLNSNITNNSSSLNTTMPEQLPPESINASKAGQI